MKKGTQITNIILCIIFLVFNILIIAGIFKSFTVSEISGNKLLLVLIVALILFVIGSVISVLKKKIVFNIIFISIYLVLFGFSKIIKIESNTPRANYTKANECFKNKNWNKAIFYYSILVQQIDSSDIAYRNLGISYYNIEDYNSAIECLSQSLAQNVDTASLRYRSLSHLKNGNIRQSYDDCMLLITIDSLNKNNFTLLNEIQHIDTIKGYYELEYEE